MRIVLVIWSSKVCLILAELISSRSLESELVLNSSASISGSEIWLGSYGVIVILMFISFIDSSVVAVEDDSPVSTLRCGCALVLIIILIPDYYP